MMSETTDALHDMTLAARELLITEISEQLEGIYGLLPSGQFRPASEYPVLASTPEAAESRRRLETLLAEEQQAGLTAQQAREKLVKEAAFTWLNRLVAFKMMETRRLLRQTVSRGQASNGFLMWLTEAGNEAHYRAYEAGDLPQDGLGEGSRQRAYRQFLLAQCARLSQEVRVLFDPATLASRLCPRPQALRQLIELLNRDQLQDAWQPGNEETIGWVYQFFIEQQKKDVFDRLYKKKEKICAEDIPAATQIFTPRWVVRCLVENTLGRLWIQMHPDSRLAQALDYLVPPVNAVPAVPLKPARDIRLLDPACGTMHFGLVAFDLLVEMYREEMAQAGQSGWLPESSVQTEADIPAAILADNLYGIDIDLRAVQLSALTLYLKAKAYNHEAMLSESRLACADIHMFNGGHLQQFLEQAGLDKRPIYGRILKALQERLKDADQLGSLLRLDDEIRKLVNEERQRYEREGRQPDFFGWPQAQFETEAGQREFWEILEIQIVQALDDFARQRSAEGADQTFFATETSKGLRLLEIMAQRYDVVITNPPYMTSGNMNAVLKQYLQKAYPLAKSDLYAAFVQRCTEWLASGGRLGMITQQSFMFISSYAKLRAFLRQRIAIETMPHVGSRAFYEISGEKVNTTLFVFRREPEAQARDEAVGVYFRLVKEPNGDAKRRRFEQAVTKIRAGQPDALVVRYRQGDFDAIPGSPWVYHLPGVIVQLFYESRSLIDIAFSRAGMHGGNRFRFARLWWEVGLENIEQACANEKEFVTRGNKWCPYIKGGAFRKWWGNQEWVVAFDSPHQKILAGCGNRLPSREFYFQPVVACSKVTSGNASFRFYPQGFIFADAVSCVFSDLSFLYNLLGILNSSFCHGILRAISPTVNFEAGHLSKIPIPIDISEMLNDYVLNAIELSVCDSQENETTWEFLGPPSWPLGIGEITHRHMQLADIEQQIDEEVYRLYGISDDDRVTIEAELVEPADLEADGDTNDEAAGDGTDEAVTEVAITPDELARRWISYAVGIVMGRFQPDVKGALGRGDFPAETAAALCQLADADGILVLDPGHPDDLPARVLQALQLMLGDSAAAEVVATATGRSDNPESELRRYFERTFFKEHIRQYRKRPVYWLLQSPGKTYGVWLFHERLTPDTLYRMRGEQYVGSKLRLLDIQLSELRQKRDAAEGRERRGLEKQVDELSDVIDDIRAFAERIDAILQHGYTPHIDDGVLINTAPLWELMPSWQAEPKKCWEALQRGDYDWSHQAMDHWPERVREQCKTNKSYAIAHGLV